MKIKEKIYAIHLISESYDHYTYCLAGDTKTILKELEEQLGDEFGFMDAVYIDEINSKPDENFISELYKKIAKARKKFDKENN